LPAGCGRIALIREAFRLQQHALPSGLDLLVRPRKGAVADFNDIARALKSLTRRIDSRLPAEPPDVVRSADQGSGEPEA
jgi:ribonuclease P protein component